MNMFGSITDFVKLSGMQTRWNLKKASGDLGKNKNKPEIPKTEKERFIESFLQTQNSEQFKIAEKVGNITDKLRMGMALTNKELDYLKAHSPMDHQKAVLIKEEREAYKKELENCRSKEEVQKVKERKALQFCTEVKSLMASGADANTKEMAREFISMRIAGVENEHKMFTETTYYKQLPQKRPIEDEVGISKTDMKKILASQTSQFSKKAEEKGNAIREREKGAEVGALPENLNQPPDEHNSQLGLLSEAVSDAYLLETPPEAKLLTKA